MFACARCLRTPRNNYSHERVRAAVAINSSPFWLILMQPESCERASTGMIDRSVATVVVPHLDDVLERTITFFSFFPFLFFVLFCFFLLLFFVLSFCYGKSLLRSPFLMEPRCSRAPICFSLQRDCIRK